MRVQRSQILNVKPPKPNARIFETIDALISVAEYDLDGLVRSQAERSMNIVREWVRKWADKPPKIDIKIREEKRLHNVANEVGERRKEKIASRK